MNAFGIDHISKSRLPGGAFKPITQMTRAERAASKGAKHAKGVTAEDAKKGQALQGNRNYMDSFNGKWKFDNNNKVRVDPVGAENGAVTVRTGGKRTGESRIAGSFSNKQMTNTAQIHENAHAKPKRSAERMRDVVSNPKKLMQEEGRADYMAQGPAATKKGTTGMSAYSKVGAARARQQANPKSYLYRQQWKVENDNLKTAAARGGNKDQYSVGGKDIDAYNDVQAKMSRAGTKHAKYEGKQPGTKIKPVVTHKPYDPRAMSGTELAVGGTALSAAGVGTAAAVSNRKKSTVKKSAFGIEHEVSKGISPKNFKTLERIAQRPPQRNAGGRKRQGYAINRVALRNTPEGTPKGMRLAQKARTESYTDSPGPTPVGMRAPLNRRVQQKKMQALEQRRARRN